MKWSLLELRRQSKVNWRARIAVTVGILVALWLVIGFFVAPPIIKSQAEKRLSLALQRPVTIARLQTNPLTLSIRIEGMVVREKSGGDFISFRSLFINFSPWSRLAGAWRLEEVALDGFIGRVAVGADGVLNVADLLRTTDTPSPAASDRASTPLAVDRLSVTDARLNLEDASQSTPFKSEVGPLTFSLSKFHTAGDPRAPYEFSARTESGETLAWRGSLSLNPLRSEGEISVSGIALPKYAPYYGSRIQFALPSGLASYSTRYTASLGKPPAVRLIGGELALSALKLVTRSKAAPLVDLPNLRVSGIEVDVFGRQVTLAKVALQGGQLDVRRTREGIDLLEALTPAPGTVKPVSSPQAPAKTPEAPGPDIKVGAIEASGLTLRFSDSTPPRPVNLTLENLSFRTGEIALADLSRTIAVQVSAAFGGGGTFAAEGTVSPAPFRTELNVTAEGLSLASLSPYVESHFDLWIAKGRAQAKGKASVSDKGARFSGDVALTEWVAVDNAADEEVASWSSLSLQAIDFDSGAPRLTLDTITWSDPSLRVSMNREGRLNLASLRRTQAAPVAAVPAVPAPAAAGAPMEVRINRFQLERARIGFSDLGQQPSVKSAVTGFSGSITGLSSAPNAQAAVDLKGKIDDAAPFSLTGKVSPLARPAKADLKFELRGADLSPMGPYVARYAGYQLERGALTLAVQLKLADRRIESSDVATLDQFTLGAKTDSPDATSLPVGLAIALLKDRRGQIVIDVPIQGNLDDPEFRVGRVVLRVLGNLLTKVATSPFALLGAAFGGGGEELSTQRFTAGSVEPAAAEQARLDTLVKALVDRPGLRLELTGHYDAGADRDALRHLEFEHLIDRTVRARRVAAGAPPVEGAPSEAEQVAALAQLYAEAFPEAVATHASAAAAAPAQAPASAPEPVGLLPRLVRFLSGRPAAVESAPAATATPTAPAKPVISVETMAEQMLSRIVVEDSQLTDLATERAQRVRTRLLQSGAVSPERVLVAPPAAGSLHVTLSLK